MKVWKTGKIVKAISEADYQKLQRSRGRNDPGPSTSNPGPSNSGLSRPPTITVSDSDSDGQIAPLVRKRKKIFHILSPPGSDSDFSPTPHGRTHASTCMERMLKDVVNIVQDVKTRVEKAVPDPHKKAIVILKEIFTCLICKQVSSESSQPVVPPCCKSVVCCYDCISQ